MISPAAMLVDQSKRRVNGPCRLGAGIASKLCAGGFGLAQVRQFFQNCVRESRAEAGQVA